MNKKTQKVDNTLLLGAVSGMILALLLWIFIVVNDIQTELKEIHNTLDIIEETLEQDGVKLDTINRHLKEICSMGHQKIECP